MTAPLATRAVAFAAFLSPLGLQWNLSTPCVPAAHTYTRARQTDSATPRDGYLTINKIRIHYIEWGRRGPALVLLHGLYDDATIWNSLAPTLASDYHVVALDRRGAGDSDAPTDGYDRGTLASDVAAVIQQLKLASVNLIGHSAGAEIALQVAVTFPGMIHSLIMIDGGFWPKHETPAQTPPLPCTKDPRACALQALEYSSRQYDPEMFYARALCPTLLIIARGDAPTGDVLEEYGKRGINYFDQVKKAEQHAKEVADKKLPHGHLVVIEHSGHWIQRDQPLVLKRSIQAFLSGIR